MTQFFSKAFKFNIDETAEGKEYLKDSYTLMSLISLLGAIGLMTFAHFGNFDSNYIAATAFVAVVYALTICANLLGRFDIGRFFISVGSPLWICTLMILMGGNFGQGIAIVSSMAITWVAYQHDYWLKIAFLIFHFVLFLIATIYSNVYSPILGVIDLPYDELVVFMGSFGWATIVFLIFNKERDDLVHNLKTNNEELLRTTDELERFNYIASHDLKSPIRTILSFTNLIERDFDKKNFSKGKSHLKHIKAGAQRMHMLVQDILEVSQLRNEKETPHTKLNLNAILLEAEENLKDEIVKNKACIVKSELHSYFGNRLDFMILFQNLIQNGIKYNQSPNPTVTITSSVKAGNLVLSFTDNGIGIEEKYHDSIFQYFNRLHDTSTYQGTGIGLGLCKRVIDLYKGTILIESSPDVGTTFKVELPLKKGEFERN